MEYESFGKPFKQIKFCKEQLKSDTTSDSVNLAHNFNINYAENHKQMGSQTEQNCSNVTNYKANKISSLNKQSKEDKKYNEIIKALGLEFIQKFAQEIRKFQTKVPTPLIALMNAAQSLKIYNMISFEVDPDPKSPKHAIVYQSLCYVKGYKLSSEKATSKKKAKFLSADTAVNTLMTIATQMSSSESNSDSKKFIETETKVSTNCNTNTASSAASDITTETASLNTIESSNLNSQLQSTKESSSDIEASNIMNILQAMREQLIIRNRKRHAKLALNDIIYNLGVQHYVTFNTVRNHDFKAVSGYTCKFFFKKTLISSEVGVTEKDAKVLAIKSAFSKIENLTNFEIKDGELKEQEKSCTTPSISHIEPPVTTEITNDIKQPFILNQMLFESSMKDSFVLFENFAIKPISQRTVRCLLSESASFCHKPFEYSFEDVLGSDPMKKVDVLLNKIVVGTGICPTKEEAKTVACEKAVDMLRKKYYTLKVKNEYIEGFIITRNQVFDGESFSNATLTDSNIGCKMLKNMGWTGGGLGASGITEPVDAGQHNFGQGLGYGKNNSNLKVFKNHIEAMLQEYSKSDSLSDLIFSKDFTKEERKDIHRLAQKYNLHTGSHGKGNDRFLTVRRKCTTPEILTYLKENGGSNSKYQLVDCSVKALFEFSSIKV